MSKLLEIFGRAITVDTADLMWHWLGAIQSAQSQKDADSNVKLSEILELIGQNKTDSAEKKLHTYISNNPECPKGRLAAAAIFIEKSQLQRAIEHLTSVYTRIPTNTMALYALGHCYERLGKESKAVEFYQDCLKFKNYLHLPRQRLAAIYFKNGQLEKTIREYELLRTEYPDDLDSLVTLGYLYIADSSFGRAMDTFNTAILIHPDNFHADNIEIDELLMEGQAYEALERIDNLLQEEPERADLCLKRADALIAIGAGEQAVEQYQEAMRLCPHFLEATIKLGTCYMQMGETELAAKQFNLAAEINDQIIEAYIGLATAQKLSGNKPEAIVTLSLAAAIGPNSSMLLAQTAILQFIVEIDGYVIPSSPEQMEQMINTVINSHQQQIKERPQNPELQNRLGVLLMSAGRLNEAIKAFENTLRLNPTYLRSASKLAICYFEINQKEQSLEQLKEPQCIDPQMLGLHYQTALLYCDRIKFASSMLNLEQFLENNFAAPEATVNIALVLQNLGLLDRAATMWDYLEETTSYAARSQNPFFGDN